jgi:hypothetical protein
MVKIPFVVGERGCFVTERLQKVVALVDTQKLQRMALQASGKYLMNHLDGVMEMVQDSHHEGELTEASLALIEAQIKAIAEELIKKCE